MSREPDNQDGGQRPEERRLSQMPSPIAPIAETGDPSTSRPRWRGLVVAALLLASVSLLVSALLFTKVGNQNHDIATGGREVARRGCELQNTTRKTLQGILKDTEPRLRQYAREGTLTQKQLNDALKDSKKAQNKLNPINCWKFASHIPVP